MKLFVFDFDDTLVKTTSVIRITDANGDTFALTPGEYTTYEHQPGDTFDYSDFHEVKEPQFIKWTTTILKKVHDSPGHHVIVITARSVKQPIIDFFEDAGYTDVGVVATGSTNPVAKVNALRDYLISGFYVSVDFFDDSLANVEAISKLRHEFPNIKFRVHHVK